MATLKLRKPAAAAGPGPAPKRAPVRGPANRPRPTLKEAQALRAERDSRAPQHPHDARKRHEAYEPQEAGKRYGADKPRHADTVRGDVELFRDAYTAEFVEFTDAVRDGRNPSVTGADARGALVLALASVESIKTGRPVHVNKGDAL